MAILAPLSCRRYRQFVIYFSYRKRNSGNTAAYKKDNRVISSYIEAIEEAQKKPQSHALRHRSGQPHVRGDGYFPDLNVNSPRDLFMLRAGTVLSINGNPWMLIEARDSAGGLNRYWSCCNGTNLSHDELYVYALKDSHNALACLHRG